MAPKAALGVAPANAGTEAVPPFAATAGKERAGAMAARVWTTCSKYCTRSSLSRRRVTAMRSTEKSLSWRPFARDTKLWPQPEQATMSPAPHAKPQGALSAPHEGQAIGKRRKAACCLAMRSMAAIARLCSWAVSLRHRPSSAKLVHAMLLPARASMGSRSSTWPRLGTSQSLRRPPAAASASRRPPAAASGPAELPAAPPTSMCIDCVAKGSSPALYITYC